MPDYPALYKRLAREIGAHEGRIDGDGRKFVAQLAVKLRAEGWTLTPAIERELADYMAAMQAAVKEGIVTALGVASSVAPLRSEQVAAMTGAAFSRHWQDGKNLSDRLWNLDQTTRAGLTRVLAEGIRQGEASGKLVMRMQRAIERAHAGQRFKIIEKQTDDWVKELHAAAQGLIHDPGAKTEWDAVVASVRERIEGLAQTGSRSAAERVFSEIRRAVSKGNEELLDKAVKWWVYDKQLYSLKRIARTEMATAGHRAVIASTENDEDVIGYQWRLAASHPRPDICDYYASIDMGLGKGVFSKDAVPKEKAHPHCVTGDTLINLPGTVNAAVKSFYRGRVVEIVTRGSRRLSCTRNHPILTDSGWLPAYLVKPAHQVISAAAVHSAVIDSNNQHMPASAKQIFGALLETRGMSSVAVPVSAKNFHGDGRFMDGDVKIVYVDRFLRGKRYVSCLQHIGKSILKNRYVARAKLFLLRVFSFLGGAFGFSSNRFMRVFCYSLSKFAGGIHHVKRLAFFRTSGHDAVFFQHAVNDDSGYLELLRQMFYRLAGLVAFDNDPFRQLYFSAHIDPGSTEDLIDRFPINALLGGDAVNSFAGPVAFDQVVEVRERDFSGFVYDFQVDPHHWYFADGILTHNCMCLLIPRITPIKQRGNHDYQSFIENASEAQRKQLLPKWADDLVADGKSLQTLLRPDGLGLILKREFLAKQVADIETLTATSAKAAVAEVVNSQAFARFVAGSDSGYYPVGVISDKIQTALAASVHTVRLSGYDRDKQLRKSREQGRDRYASLQAMIDRGEVIQYKDRAVSVFLQIDGQWHHAALKATEAGDEVYLKSLRRSDAKQLLRDRKRGRVISAG